MTTGNDVLQHQNFHQNEIREVRFEQLSSDPIGSDLYQGRFWQNTTSSITKYYDGATVQTIPYIDDATASALSTYSSTKIELIVANLQAGADWQANVTDVQLDNTLDPTATPTLGSRYAINDKDNLNANFGTITGLANGDIVQYDGTEFVIAYHKIDGGAFAYNDANGALYVLNGSLQWVSFIVYATTAVAGIVTLATQVETEAVTVSTKAITPDTLINFAQKRVITSQAFTADIEKIITHGLGSTAVITSVVLFPTGTNSNGASVYFDNKANGTIGITLNGSSSATYDVHIIGTVA